MKQKTADYKNYQNEIRDIVIFHDGDSFHWPFGNSPVHFHVQVGLSNKAADLDNIIKPLLDTYQSMYEEFNDKYVYGISLAKDLVPKGEEYLDVSIIPKNLQNTGENNK